MHVKKQPPPKKKEEEKKRNRKTKTKMVQDGNAGFLQTGAKIHTPPPTPVAPGPALKDLLVLENYEATEKRE